MPYDVTEGCGGRAVPRWMGAIANVGHLTLQGPGRTHPGPKRNITASATPL